MTLAEKDKNVAVALSGGIDSSVTAAILKKQGYRCIGLFMHLWFDDKGIAGLTNRCCSIESYRTAIKVSRRLNFPLYSVNLKADFKKIVVDEFLQQYQNGLTPNPCIWCNQFIKFDLLWQKAKALGCNYLATGHYLRKNKKQKVKGPKGPLRGKIDYTLFQAKDKRKDQSYFLYAIKRQLLPHLIFPLGNYSKAQVRVLAKKWQLPSANRPESQEICFTGNKCHNEFLKRYLNLKAGPIFTAAGKKIGEHQGLPLYTLGQRRGIKIGGIGPFYVVKQDYQNNALIVSPKKDDPLLYVKEFKIKEINWLIPQLKFPLHCRIKIRYQTPAVRGKVEKNKVILTKAQRAVTPGQSAVFYSGQKLLGGGTMFSSQ